MDPGQRDEPKVVQPAQLSEKFAPLWAAPSGAIGVSELRDLQDLTRLILKA